MPVRALWVHQSPESSSPSHDAGSPRQKVKNPNFKAF